MLKYKEMITVLGLIIFGVIILLPILGANPVGQARPLPSFKKDTNVTIPVPSIFLEKALKDSLEKLNSIKKNNDSLRVVRSNKWDRILRSAKDFVKNKKNKVIKVVDTVYIPTPIVIDSSFKDLYLINLN